jgi:NADPH:quinone reductase-like Zn-dependent oxidoreductase
LRAGGRLLVVGFAAGEIPRIALNLPLLKDCSIAGVFLASQTRNYPARFVANMKDLFDLALRGQLEPVVRELECFSQYEAALTRVADRETLGKVVMRVAARVEEHVTKTYPSATARPVFAEGALVAAP